MRKRRKPRLKRRQRRFRLSRKGKASIALVLMAATVILLVAGTGGSVSQSTTPAARTTTPSPVPFTSAVAQSADTTAATSTPQGAADISAQVSNGTATTTGSPGLAASTAQTADATATNIEPSGSASIAAQTVNATATHTEPSGTAAITEQTASANATTTQPSGAIGSQGITTWYPGTFTLDTDGDGATNTVYFVLTDASSMGTIGLLELSSDDSIFGETATSTTLWDQTTGTDDDELLSAGVGSSTSADVTIGTHTFTVEFQHAVSGGQATASITAKTWFTGTFAVDVDANGTSTDAADTVSFALVDSDSNGLYDTMDISTDDATFGETGPDTSLSDLATGSDDDERFEAAPGEGATGCCTSQDIALGTYTFTVEFQHAASSGQATSSVESRTWYEGTFFADLNADGDTSGNEDIVAFVLTDADSDGVYDTMDISTDDGPLVGTTFGEGTTADQATGSGDDETISSGEDVLLGADYTFTAAFDANPPEDSSDASITAQTHFEGSFIFDADADGATTTAETVYYGLSDTDSDGLYDTMDLSLGDQTFDQASTGDSKITSSGNDERITATATVKVGSTYSVSAAFDSNPPDDSSDATITLATDGTTPIAYTGSWTIDAEPDQSADDPVFFVLSDTNSDGVVDTMDVSIGDSLDDAVFGEDNGGALDDGEVDFDIVNGINDERVAITSIPYLVTLGTHRFLVEFDADVNGDTDDARITSLWYVGTFSVDIEGNGSDETLDFVQVDPDSDGLYTVFELDGDDSGSYGPSEVHTSSPTTVTLGTVQAILGFWTNPTVADSASLADVSPPSSTPTPTLPDSGFGFLSDDEGLPETEDWLDVSADGEMLPHDAVEDALDEIADVLDLQDMERELELAVELTGLLELQQELSELIELAEDPAAELELVDELADVREEIEATEEELDLDAVEVPAEAAQPPPARITRDVTGQPVVTDEVIIGLDFRVPNPELIIKLIAEATGGVITGSVPETRTYQLRIPADTLQVTDKVQSIMDEIPGMTVSHHYLMDIEGGLARIPNDTGYGSWNVTRPSGNNWNMEFIRAPLAWDVTTGSKSVPVAVIDADFDRGHTDLDDNVTASFGRRSTVGKGHGTHVAGTICAEGNNKRGVSGVSWDCSLRVYDFGATSPVLAQQAMIRAVKDGARIVNVSLQWIDHGKCGTPVTNATLKKVAETNAIFARAIQYAQRQKKDVLWVFAAGNECRDAEYASPASLALKFPNNTIVVASIGVSGRLSPFSNYGRIVTVAAPGGQILSTLPRRCETKSGKTECFNRYGEMSGTSMAAPHVTGLAVLVKSRNPRMMASHLKQCIVKTARRSVPGHRFRVIDAAGAVSCRVAAPQKPKGAGSPARPFGGGLGSPSRPLGGG